MADATPPSSADSDIRTFTLPSGLTLLAEPIEGVQSLGMTLLLPAGTIHEPDDRQGAAGVLAELICRGAGGLSAREHSDELDRLGVHRSANAGG
ncbi:MAG: insulinase family protein, partial [Phycisphaeraceae bacterium]